jgi:hypothetical protein
MRLKINNKFMSKAYKILIVCTFLIGLFFLGKYIWVKIPRYEWQKRIWIAEGNIWPMSGVFDKNCYCQEVEIKDCEYNWTKTEYTGDSIIFHEAKELCTKPITKIICYIKEKVRIN